MVKKNLTFLKRFKIFISCVICCIALAMPLFSNAQEIDTLKVNQLEEVQVNQYRISKQLLSPAALQVLTAADLKRSNSLSVADAIRYLSGIQLKDYGGVGGLKTVNVRGMGSNHTAVFYDGIQLGNAQNGQVDLGKYALDNLEEISLLSGQNTDFLQPAKAYATASSIFLRTKKPEFLAGTTQHLTASFKTGSFGLLNPSLSYQYKITENTALSVSSAYIHANGKYKFRYTNGVYDTTAVRSNGDVERFRLESALFGKLKNGSWQAQVYLFTSDRGLPGAVIANKFDYNQRAWDQNFFVQGRLTQAISDKFSVALHAKVANDITRFVDPAYITLNGVLDNRFEEREAYFSAAAKYKLNPHWTINLSSDYQYQDLEANIYRFAYPRRNTFLNVLSTTMQSDRLLLQANVLHTSVSDQVKIYGAAGSKQVFSPALLFSWKILPEQNLRLRGFYKDIFRMPTFNDSYYTYVGNTQLKPEFTKQYNLGFTYLQDFNKSRLLPLELLTDVYYNEVKDKIIAQPGANLLRWIMFNLGKVTVKGVEFNVKTGLKLGKEFTLGTALNYTYQQAIDVTDPTESNYRDQIPYVPNHSGSFLAKLDYRDWKLNYSFIYTGFRYNQKANITYNYMEPWYTHDLAIGRELKLQQQTIQFNIEVNNLLNQYYDVIPNFPMPGRNFRLNLTFTL